MSNKKIQDNKKKNRPFYMLFTFTEFNQIIKIKNLLNISIAEFVRICIQEWIENHKDVIHPIF